MSPSRLISAQDRYSFPPFSREHVILRDIAAYTQSLNAVRQNMLGQERSLKHWHELKIEATSDEMKARYALMVEQFLDTITRSENDIAFYEGLIVELEAELDELLAPREVTVPMAAE